MEGLSDVNVKVFGFISVDYQVNWKIFEQADMILFVSCCILPNHPNSLHTQ